MTNLTNLDELIAAERKKSNDKIAKLRRAVAAEQRRVNARVVVLLSEQQPDLYDRLASLARAALDEEKAERSRKARDAAATRADDATTDEAPTPDDAEVVRHSWNG